MSGLSVVPGLPNMYSTPCATRVSMRTCLPRMPMLLRSGMLPPGQSPGPHGRGGDQGGGAGEGEGQDVAARDVEEVPRLPRPERAAGGPADLGDTEDGA